MQRLLLKQTAADPSTPTVKRIRKVLQRYLDLSCMVYDNQAQENDCRKAYQAF